MQAPTVSTRPPRLWLPSGSSRKVTRSSLSPTRPFDLPAEAEDVRRVVTELHSAIQRISEVHTFGKGMGIAAPQIGIDRSAALVKLPNGDMITLLNPRIIDQTDDTDEQYEGCLSFFDVRGMVPRPLAIHVEHQDVDGQIHLTQFDGERPASSATRSTTSTASSTSPACETASNRSRSPSTRAVASNGSTGARFGLGDWWARR